MFLLTCLRDLGAEPFPSGIAISAERCGLPYRGLQAGEESPPGLFVRFRRPEPSAFIR